MKPSFYINVHFQNYVARAQGKEYIKISCELTQGVFCALAPKDTKKVSIQKFNSFHHSNIYGVNGQFCLKDSVFFDNIGLVSNEDLDLIYKCSLHMTRSFRSFSTSFCPNMELSEKAEIYREIQAFFQKIEEQRKLRKNSQSAETEEDMDIDSSKTVTTHNTEEKWQNLSEFIDVIHSEVIVSVTDKLLANKCEFVIEDGRKWRLADVNGRKELQACIYNGKTDETPKNDVTTQIRKTKKMALIVNAEGLTDFFENHLYYIKNEHSDYISVQNILGETREINRFRLRIIDVFTEPPVEVK